MPSKQVYRRSKISFHELKAEDRNFNINIWIKIEILIREERRKKHKRKGRENAVHGLKDSEKSVKGLLVVLIKPSLCCTTLNNNGNNIIIIIIDCQIIQP